MKLETLLQMSDMQAARYLIKSGYLQKQTACYHCKLGSLTSLAVRGKGVVQRCRNRACHKFCSVQVGSPLFWYAKNGASLRQQTGILFAAVWGIPQKFVPALIKGVQHKPVDRMYKAWRMLVRDYVRTKQDGIKFGHGDTPGEHLDEHEWDETAVRKVDEPHHQVLWTEYVMGKRRGDRESLYAEKRAPRQSRSTRCESGRVCPPPMTKEEWVAIRGKRVSPGALSHTDGAPAYTSTSPGSYHDSVSHSKQGGKKPQWTKLVKHNTPDGKVIATIGGTQCLDGWSAHGKRATYGVQSGNSKAIDAHFREEQWHHWIGDRDRWAAAVDVIQYVP